MKYSGKLVILILTLLALASGRHAVASTPTPLPPTAQEALNKGIIAAKVPDYLLATRYFEEARRAAPQAPVIYLNLGLAESRIPGRELRAIAWFGAYLAAYPDAPNAAAVKEQIGVLDVRNRSNVLNLVNSVQDAADKLSRLFPNGPPPDCDGCDPPKNPNLVVAELWASAGDITAALKLADLIPNARDKSFAYRHIAGVQAEHGDIAGALKTADLIHDASNRGYTYRSIANAQAKSADFAGALNAAGLIQDGDNNRIYAYREIAIAQAENGEIEGALNTVAAAQKAADLIKNETDKKYALTAIADAQAKSGDIAGALKTADLVQDKSRLAESLSYIAEAQAKSGAAAVAQKTFADAIKAANGNKYVLYLIAKSQAKSGDIAGTRKSAELIKDAYWEIIAQIDIAEAQVKSGDIAGARKTFVYALQTASKSDKLVTHLITKAQAKAGITNAWIKILDDAGEYMYSDCPLNTEPFLNLSDHLKSLPSNDAQKIFYGLSEVAKKIVKAQNTISQMLKQQQAGRGNYEK